MIDQGHVMIKSCVGLAVLVGALLIALFGPQLQANSQGIDLPPGFAMLEITSGMTRPLDVEFIPSGEILIAEKGTSEGSAGQSALRLIRNGVLQEEPLITLSTNVDVEAGIAGIILDPDFSDNHYFYVWYATGENALDWSGTTELRLSRFTLDLSAGIVDPASELIMLDGLAWQDHHNGGGMAFDNQGNLYLAIGDIGLYSPAQDQAALHGKVLRIRPTESRYTVPADNPFVGVEDAREEIYALGLRNPYRMTRRRADDKLFFGDVGGAEWEEVNLVTAGANFGWSGREGPCPWNVGELPCEPTPPEYTDPVLYYPHSEIGASITALAFYEGQSFPAEYQNQLFFADFNSQYIAFGDVDGDDPTEIERFAQPVGRIVDMEYHKDSLYVLDFNGGDLSMIYYQKAENQAPSARLAIDRDVGAAPLNVTLSAEEVSDADDIVFTYQWDFGDQSDLEVTTTPFVSHTYTTDGTYVASLKVLDIRGTESEVLTKTITVYSSSEIAQIAIVNLSRPSATLYHGGDQIQYRAIRKSGTADLDPQRPYSWRIERHREQQIEPLVVNEQASEGSLDIPRDHYGGTVSVWYRFYLTMHTADGQDVTVSQDLYPAVVTLTIETFPPAIAVSLNQESLETPNEFEAVVGVEHYLEMPRQVLYHGMSIEFVSWQSYQNPPTGEPNAIVNDNQWRFIVPAVDTTYQARYGYTELMLPIIMRSE